MPVRQCALDAAKWAQRSFDTGVMHGGIARWNNGQNLQSTDTSDRLHVRRGSDLWLVDGFNQRVKNSDARGWGHHPGYHEFHVQSLMWTAWRVQRLSPSFHADDTAPGGGGDDVSAGDRHCYAHPMCILPSGALEQDLS